MIELGEVILLDGEREFLCFEKMQLDGKEYLYLIATDESGEIQFAEQAVNNGEAQVRVIGNKELKNRMTAAFQAKYKAVK